MKLFARYNRSEGQMLESNVFLTIGRNQEGDGSFNGTFFRVEIPFTRKMKTVDPKSFNIKEMPSRPVLYVMKRLPKSAVKPVTIWHLGWLPVEQ